MHVSSPVKFRSPYWLLVGSGRRQDLLQGKSDAVVLSALNCDFLPPGDLAVMVLHFFSYTHHKWFSHKPTATVPTVSQCFGFHCASSSAHDPSLWGLCCFYACAWLLDMLEFSLHNPGKLQEIFSHLQNTSQTVSRHRSFSLVFEICEFLLPQETKQNKTK